MIFFKNVMTQTMFLHQTARHNYFDNNEIIINLKKGKTEVMIVRTAKRLNKCTGLVVKYRDFVVSEVSSYKYLGVLIGNTLNFRLHF